MFELKIWNKTYLLHKNLYKAGVGGEIARQSTGDFSGSETTARYYNGG